MVAHRSQLFAIPDDVSNEVAVLLEPFACAIHAAKRAAVAPGETVSDEDFKEQLETLNEELETLNTQPRDLEQTIASNVAEILEA